MSIDFNDELETRHGKYCEFIASFTTGQINIDLSVNNIKVNVIHIPEQQFNKIGNFMGYVVGQFVVVDDKGYQLDKFNICNNRPFIRNKGSKKAIVENAIKKLSDEELKCLCEMVRSNITSVGEDIRCQLART